MAKYLISVSYTADGLKGLHKDKASGRKKAVTAAVESLGGKLDTMYYALGKYRRVRDRRPSRRGECRGTLCRRLRDRPGPHAHDSAPDGRRSR